MLPRNVVEVQVRESLLAHLSAGSADGGVCWCPLCLADMQALALSSLPPKYVTRREDRAELDAFHREAVREEVDRAIRWVGSHPKHPPGTQEAPDAPVSLVNLAYEVGFSLVDERVNGHVGACECFDCRCDAVAFALNRFPPRYGVARGGRSVFTADARRELGADLVPFVDHGLRVVTDLPRH